MFLTFTDDLIDDAKVIRSIEGALNGALVVLGDELS